MNRHTHQACTSFLAGKLATIDGSTLIARNEDNFVAIWPKRALKHATDAVNDSDFISKNNGFHTQLPTHSFAYTAMPDTDPSEGYYEESGINDQNVAMSATESAYTNSHVLGIDPLVTDGIAEDAMLTVVLPYVDSARTGIQRLGDLVTTNGAAETNGVLFSDTEEVWYMEIVSGHHWVAQRIPDDAYAVVANQLAIEDIDFTNAQNFMTSPDIRHFVQANRLNPDGNRFNSRHIFGTHNADDAHYNTPRVWYGHKLFTPSAFEEPISMELPFIQHAEHKISIEEVEAFLGSHYQETPFDPLGHGTDEERHRFRAVGLARTQNSHILQLRRHVSPLLTGVIWQCLGNPAFSPYVPFYAAGDQLGSAWSANNADYSPTNPYWAAKLLDVLSEDHYHQNRKLLADFQKQAQIAGLHRLTIGDATGQPTSATLGSFNAATADELAQAIHQQTAKLVQANAELSQLTFTMDQNL
ncbi:C69 family dipeptidase [Levilactobacillus tongjiangensis]|uniref:Dipeptidase n=1 Tax=Levilactobacillus tongjiangensis TaxID=2486023 RepID=A0ABW1SPJ6_9LACO|nr:C69 family dipeptidase [Levilactobacillus tongjiangensis]